MDEATPTPLNSVWERQAILNSGISYRDRKRMLVLVISEMADRVLSAEGVEPEGMTVTIRATDVDGLPNLEVVASAPQHDLVE